MNRVSIIGFGRFGAMLHSLLSKGFEVDVFDKNSIDNSDVNEVSLCLLYTSPSPRDAESSRMPSSA